MKKLLVLICFIPGYWGLASIDTFQIRFDSIYVNGSISVGSNADGKIKKSGQLWSMGANYEVTRNFYIQAGVFVIPKIKEDNIFPGSISVGPNRYSFKSHGVYSKFNYLLFEIDQFQFYAASALYFSRIEENLTEGTSGLLAFQNREKTDISGGLGIEIAKSLGRKVRITGNLTYLRYNGFDSFLAGLGVGYKF